MSNQVIIGAGFSAAICQLLLKDAIVKGSLDHLAALKGSKRRRNIEKNKFFSKKASSYGSVSSKNLNINLHDRLIENGNSEIWGGFIDERKIPEKLRAALHSKNIQTKKLSLNGTGSFSNNESLSQLLNKNQKIMQASDILNNIENEFLNKIIIKKNRIYLEMLNKKGVKKKIAAKEIILCIGTVQLIDLLYRSNFIKDGDTIELSEFSYKLKIAIGKKIYDTNSVIIRFCLGRAILHYLGIQEYKPYISFLNKLNIFIDQIFLFKINKYKLIIKNAEFFGLENEREKFGQSIHYCDMKINGININHLLSKIHPKIFGVGMPYVKQKKPGPISNDIISDATNKLLSMK
jgi:hypothetical protein